MLSDRDIVRKLGSVGLAFFGQFHYLREIQRQAIDPILSGRNVLLTSATASGKTEAVLAPLVAHLRERTDNATTCVRLLAIAPTRALVNDLYNRLKYPLSNIHWTCGRQTSDYKDKIKQPHVLITTPESFDSMLVRGGRWQRGILTGHLLACVSAVFIDEAHLFESSPRGDQVIWLLARLQRLRNYAFQKSWWPSDKVQICAASATVDDPHFLAKKLLGDTAVAVQVQGNRELEIHTLDPGERWKKIEDLQSVNQIYHEILRVNGLEDFDSMAGHIWSSISAGETEKCRKVLIFVPSRSLCDRLSTILAEELGKRRDIFVSGHHGSLEKPFREEAEKQFARRRDAVLVATTTLEVGIDIGDVDIVALIGPPPDASSLLQRIGRAGRRSGSVKIVPIARTEMETRAFASILHVACRGILDQQSHGRRWSIFIQQAASFIAQSGKKGRRRKDVIQLAEDIWPEKNNSTPSMILEKLIDEEYFVAYADRLFLGESLSDQLEEGRGDLHHNFESDSLGLPVVDSTTGETIARVSSVPGTQGTVALAGQKWKYKLQSGEVALQGLPKDKGLHTFKYASRAAPCRRSFAEHVKRGVGLAPTDAPVIRFQEKLVWFHFAGSAYELVLLKLFPVLKPFKKGIVAFGSLDEKELRTIAKHHHNIILIVRSLADQLKRVLSPGKYHRLLPDDIKTSVIGELFDIDTFIKWLTSVNIIEISSHDLLYQSLVSLITD